MTTYNASGAGMETVARVRSVAAGADGVRITWCGPFAAVGEELVRRTDATRLLAESQAQHRRFVALVAKLADQLADSPVSLVESLREAIEADGSLKE